MLRGTRIEHRDFLMRWLRGLETQANRLLEVAVQTNGVCRDGVSAVTVRLPKSQSGRLVVIFELDGLESRIAFCRPEYLGMARQAIARLKDRFAQ